MKPDNTPLEDKFLGAVARYFLKHGGDLSQLWLVFPNKRGPIIFRRYLKLLSRRPMVMPVLTTIGALNESFAGEVVEPDRTELLFILYKAYVKVLTSKGFTPRSFDSFAWWGSVMLDDFDAIDSSLVDACDLYTNIERYNEIRSNFLTDEQLDLLRGIWGEEAIANLTGGYASADSSSKPFWTHLPDASGHRASDRFLRLWAVTYDIYREFGDRLRKLGLSYPGMTQRRVVRTIREMNTDELPFGSIAFVGFSNVSLATAGMMQILQDRRMAEFFWDELPDRPYLQSARRLISRLSRRFPAPADFRLPIPDTMPRVHVVSVPSSFMQTKAAAEVIDRLGEKHLINTTRADNTCILLPDTGLLTAMLHAMPEKVGDRDLSVNVTMGLSYRDTPFASLLSAIVSMHLRRRVIGGRMAFFHEDIKALVSTPILHGLMPRACEAVSLMLARDHQYHVEADFWRRCPGSEPLAPLFAVTPAEGPAVTDYENIASVRRYITGVIDTLMNALEANAKESGELSDTNEGKILEAYREGVERIFDCLDRYNITEIGEGGILGLVEKLLAVKMLNMSGTPLAGLQVMGMLETRALDFENLLVLSANERILPRHSYRRSLIPQAICRAFGMPVSEDTDSEYAYYFFRLLTRARRLYCFYDSRSAGLSSGAMSPYLLQLRLLTPPGTVSFGEVKLLAQAGESRTLRVDKSPEVLRLLQGYKDAEHGFNLSATALKKYMQCTLRFYLDCVRGVREDDEPRPFMTATVYGSVMHAVLEEIYNEVGAAGKGKPVPVTAERLVALSDKRALKERVLRAINKLHHNGLYDGRMESMPGESRLIAEMMVDFVEKVLQKDINDIKQGQPFSFVAAEYQIASAGRNGTGHQWRVNDSHTVNIDMLIDRVDMLSDGSLRFIDYKTGDDMNVLPGSRGRITPMDNILGGNHDYQAVFQLLFYALVYSEMRPGEAHRRIVPSIYRLNAAFKEFAKKEYLQKFENDGIYIGKNRIIWNDNTGESDFDRDEFRARISALIDDIFDPDVPFVQTPDRDHCKFCPYKTICRREDDSEDDDESAKVAE